MEDLQAEMKLLNWHKLANEAALKAALIRTKKLKKTENPAPSQSLQDKASWMQQVIEEEQKKPLQVSRDFIHKYEAQEKLEEERLDQEVQRHIQVLQKLRTKVQDRDDLRQRKQNYKVAQASLHDEKQRILASVAPNSRRDDTTASSPTPISNQRKVQGTLTTVINSLDKLVELEQRISTLENDSLYDRLTEQHSSASKASGPSVQSGPPPLPRGGRSTLQFSKKKAPPSANVPAARTYYSVKMAEKRQRKTRGALAGPAPGSQYAATKKRIAAGKSSGPKGGRSATGSTFLTGVPEPQPAGRQARVPRGAGRAGPGVRRMPGQSRQDAQVSDWLDKKNARVQRGGRAARDITKGQGASGARKYGNKSMQQFHEVRGQMEKRKADMRKQLQSTTKSAARGIGASGTMRVPAGRLTSKTAPQRNARGVNVAGRSSRAPRGSANNTAAATAGRGGRGASSRMPAIRQGRGGNTNLSISGPGRLSGRGPGGRGAAGKLPHVAGSGVKGVRAVRQAW